MYENIVAGIVLAFTEVERLVFKTMQDDDVAALQKLIKEDGSILQTEISGMPLLVAAFHFGLPKMAEMLLEAGADPTERTPENKSFLEYVRDGHDFDAKKTEFIKSLEKHGYKFEREDLTNQIVKQSFEFEGFQVINAGLRENKMDKVLNACSKLFRRMKKFGFGKILYGPLIITSKDLDGKVFNEQAKEYKDIKAAALYYIEKDLIVINADSFLANIENNLQLLAHELGHRHYYRFMDQSQRQLWNGKFDERALKVEDIHAAFISKALFDNAPIQKDSLGGETPDWTQFNYDAFIKTIRSKQKSNRLLDILDGMISIWKHGDMPKGAKEKLRKDFIFDDILQKNEGMFGTYWCARTIGILADYISGKLTDTSNVSPFNLRRELIPEKAQNSYEFAKKHLQPDGRTTFKFAVGKIIEAPKSSTEYGRNNSSEDYAEAFGNFIANLPMPKEIYHLFIRVNNLKLARCKNGMHKTNPQMRTNR